MKKLREYRIRVMLATIHFTTTTTTTATDTLLLLLLF
jgi:hypothetical protein